MKKINVVGTSGSGKSTLARRLALLNGVPYVEMDLLFWGANWTQRSDEEFFAALEKALAPSGWVLDGNYTRTIPIKWREIDLVVWIDLPFILNFYQSLSRALKRVWSREELWPGTNNRESFFKLFFSSDSILWWMIKTHAKNRRSYQSLAADSRFKHIEFVRLRNRSEIEEFCKRFTGVGLQAEANTSCDTNRS